MIRVRRQFWISMGNFHIDFSECEASLRKPTIEDFSTTSGVFDFRFFLIAFDGKEIYRTIGYFS